VNRTWTTAIAAWLAALFAPRRRMLAPVLIDRARRKRAR